MNQLNRKQMMVALEQLVPEMKDHMRPAEEFYGRDEEENGGIWTSGEHGFTMTVQNYPHRIFSYWSEDYEEKLYIGGVLKVFDTWLRERGWFSEFYDAGTVMLYPI